MYLSIISLNFNRLDVLIEDIEWMNRYKDKIHAYVCCLKETYFRSEDKERLKVRQWEKLYHANRNQKKSGVAILYKTK